MEAYQILENIGFIIDGVGVAIILIGCIISSVFFLSELNKKVFEKNYENYRQNLARVILLGLEFLIAGDIIRSVATTPTITNVLILGMIVLIRTILSIQLQAEIKGKLPWKR